MADLLHFHFDELDSTQDEAFRLLERATPAPFFVTALMQTHGRGRQGRVWHMEKGRSLALTLVVRLPSDRLEGLSLLVGLGILECLQESSLRLKWPNDIMLDDQKIGGVLIESKSSGAWADVAIGIGLNLLPLQNASYSSLKRIVSEQALATTILGETEKFIEKGFSFYSDRYNDVLWKKGEDVDFMVGG